MPDERVRQPETFARLTMSVPEVAAAFGVSEWALYESIRRGDCPVPAIRIGRRIVFATSRVREILGLDRCDSGEWLPRTAPVFGEVEGHDEVERWTPETEQSP